MKICFLAHAGSIHTERWVNYFVEQRHSVSLVSFTPPRFEYPGVEVHILDSRFPISRDKANVHYLVHLPRLRKLLAKLNPDLINAHFLSSYGFMAALARPAGCPLAVTLHGSDILLFPKRSALHARVTRFSLGRANMVVSVAQHITDTLPSYMTGDVPVLTIQYGIELQRFSPSGGPDLRAPVCFSNRALVALSNLETLISAGQILDAQGSQLIIELAGSGQHMPQLRSMVEQRGLAQRIKFIGPLEHRLMPEYLRRVAIYVTMSRSDGTSLSLLEAMACGAFPIVSDIAANREWIQDGVNGFVVDPDSAVELADKIEEAWARTDLRRRAAERNWEMIQEKADYQKNMARIAGAFADLVQ